MESEPTFSVHWRKPPAPTLPYLVPDRLWILESGVATRVTLLPVYLQPHPRGRYEGWDLGDHGVRAEMYIALLRDGTGEEMLNFMSCDLLVAAWTWLRLPREVRSDWDPLIVAWKDSE
ncbi:hypothetical protein B5P43_15615 [Bacillus sp. SRB_336]|nr:hypothetical protein B5P43_15615 [Bacillus sp. SRB_336]